MPQGARGRPHRRWIVCVSLHREYLTVCQSVRTANGPFLAKYEEAALRLRRQDANAATVDAIHLPR
jgi:hypothetical protein